MKVEKRKEWTTEEVAANTAAVIIVNDGQVATGAQILVFIIT